MKNKTIEDAVRELDGDWNNAVNAGQCPDFTYLCFVDEEWEAAHPNSSLVDKDEAICTRAQFEIAAKKYNAEKAETYIPQAGDWFLLAYKKSESFLERKYFCIGRSNTGNVVCEDSDGNVYSNSTEKYKFEQSYLSVEDEWKMQAYALLGEVSEPKDVIHKIYRALVSGKLPIPKY